MHKGCESMDEACEIMACECEDASVLAIHNVNIFTAGLEALALRSAVSEEAFFPLTVPPLDAVTKCPSLTLPL